MLIVIFQFQMRHNTKLQIRDGASVNTSDITCDSVRTRRKEAVDSDILRGALCIMNIKCVQHLP